MTPSTQHSESQKPRRALGDYLKLTACGFAMGAADVVPGVSGGTMAFILGIYEELIHSIRAFSMPANLKYLWQFKLRQALDVFPWRFLAAVGLGIFTAIFSLAHGLEWALEAHPALLWAFFFGLVTASIITVIPRVRQWRPQTLAALFGGAVTAYLIVGLTPAHTPETWWFLFLSGAIAICAMILPGISGSFILVLLGKYQMILEAVTQRNVVVLFWVMAGIIVGILSFARVLEWLFARYHDLTVAILIGFMAGSLRKIWPWKQTLETMLDRHGQEVPIIQANMLPAWSGAVAMALALAGLGAGTVLILHAVATRRTR